MGDYKFDINRMSTDARQDAAEAARTTLPGRTAGNLTHPVDSSGFAMLRRLVSG
ncbi:hypothetical protein CCUG60885_04655 [Mycobacteroides salmoniphilum]|uniref:Uncharacterized protein n=1 Tax=Mycobacteroides salmoniphilum TaxID=404941 RepID=A0A4R8S7Q2_9MYCO|nr:hypothetical protein CCUG60885_04655 [Mycobacteroides salmoniphilum]TDZ99974.1 hypothetical protein CCUG60883_04658 [Mycobacteroides salmoniphilum]